MCIALLTYNHRNRLLTTTTTLNSGSPATVTYAYNELGQLQTKKLGSASTIANQYNIQGWLASQTSPKFSLGLDYSSSGRRDGNITKLSWGQGSATDQYYTLNYDKFGRMTTGVHSLSKFNETIGSYDLNGNIKSLTRTANGSASDNFTYTYSGNRLTNLSGITGTYTYDDTRLFHLSFELGVQFPYPCQCGMGGNTIIGNQCVTNISNLNFSHF